MSDDAETMSETTKKNYFGDGAKPRFNLVLSKIARQRYLYTERTEDFLSKQESYTRELEELEGEEKDEFGIFGDKMTARQKFAAFCIEDNMLPTGSLILRKTFSPHIDLAHMSIGNEMAVKVAAVIRDLPMVTSLNVRDNRLTDLGVGSIITCIIKKPDLQYLDLSENKVDGEASEALAQYVNTHSCSLTELYLSNADVDDEEVQGFTEALHVNRTLNTLDLSHNLIGNAENLNIVQPDLVTGGEAIAEMLLVNNTLTKLDLSWNSIRMGSAVEVGKALGQNTGLKELNLSYNAFGNTGAQAIGESLLSNNCLEKLNLSNNNIPGQGAFVLAKALQGNSSLGELILDGNPLGSMGGRALLQSVANAAHLNFQLSVESCNFDMISQDMFDPEEATGTYDLDMLNPYERSIAIELLRLANTKTGCKFISVVHITTSISATGKVDQQKQSLQLEVRQVPKTRAKLLRRKSTMVVNESLSKEKLMEVFNELDADGSGSIDATELGKGMKAFGLAPAPGEMSKLIAQYDLDGTGTIEAEEFIELMSEFDHSEEPIHEVVDISTGYSFIIPTEGFLKIEFLDTHCQTEAKEASTREGVERLISNLQTSSNRVKMMNMAKTGMCLKATEAQLLIDALLEETDILTALCILLPQLVDGRQAHQLIESNLDRKQRLMLQNRLGQSYGPLVGMPTGHYKLDLSEEDDRFVALRLMELANKTALYRKKNGLPDTSQKKNYFGYRNEVLNGSIFELKPEFFDNLPRFGMLELDFVSMVRPPKDTQPLSDARFNQVVRNLNLHRFDPMMPSTETPNAAFSKLKGTRCFETMREMQSRRCSDIPQQFVQSVQALHEKVMVDIGDGNQVVWDCRKLLLELQAALSNRYITAAQAIRIMKNWPMCYANSRIDAVVIMFSRIVDLYNIYKVYCCPYGSVSLSNSHMIDHSAIIG